jgi:hypothetical protein
VNAGGERELIDALFRGLEGTFLEGQLVLGGSSGLFAFSTATPAYTEDLDFYIDEQLVATRGAEIVRLLAELGYRRHPETPTFSAPERPTFDLVGYSQTNRTDHLSPPGALRVMVFGELGVVLACRGSVSRTAGGRAVLSPAGFTAVKLLTVRVEKGAKDKLQALLVISERSGDASFGGTLSGILGHFDEETRADALADAQMAFLSLRKDPTFRDHGAERYASFLEGLERGYQSLVAMIKESLDG